MVESPPGQTLEILEALESVRLHCFGGLTKKGGFTLVLCTAAHCWLIRALLRGAAAVAAGVGVGVVTE